MAKRLALPIAALIILVGFKLEPAQLPRLSEATRPRPVFHLTPPTTSAWAYFHPAWSPDWVDGEPPPNAGHFDLRALETDPYHRLESDFQVPPSLTGRVHFWIEIFSRFTHEMRVFHDRDNPGLVYGYLDFRPLFSQVPSEWQRRQLMSRMEREILRDLPARLVSAWETSPAEMRPYQERAQIRGFLAAQGVDSLADVRRLAGEIRTQTGERDEFLTALARSQNLLPQLETIFAAQGLPRWWDEAAALELPEILE